MLALRRQGLVHSVRRRQSLGKDASAREIESPKRRLEPITAAPAGNLPSDASLARADRPRLVLTGEQDLAMAGLGPALAAEAFAPFLFME